jgi:tetratricopeptide (TPR) repeat protein
MATSTSRQGQRDHLADLLHRQLFDEALGVISSLERSRALDPSELVAKGRTILLASVEVSVPLSAAREAFEMALELDPDSLPALLELGWYYHAVEDDSERALPFFERAIELSREHLTEAARGRAGCLAELSSQAAAAASLKSLHQAGLLVEKLSEEEQGWIFHPSLEEK